MDKIFSFYKRFKTYIHNSAWIMGEKVLAILLGFFVTVLVARYLGPQDYGVLSYAISLVALFSVAGHMGLDGLLVREIIKKPEHRGEIIGTSLGLKLFGVTVAFCILLLYTLLYEGANSKEFLVVMATGLTLFFKPVEVVTCWFQAYLQAKYAAIARGFSLAFF